MHPRKQVVLFIIALTLTACASCNKPTIAPLPETPYTKAARAADDIASGIKLLLAAELNLAQQKIITPQEDLLVIKAIGELSKANTQYTNDIDAARVANNQLLMVPAGKALVKAAAGITSLTIKNPQAQATFANIMAGVNLALGVVQNFLPQQ